MDPRKTSAVRRWRLPNFPVLNISHFDALAALPGLVNLRVSFNLGFSVGAATATPEEDAELVRDEIGEEAVLVTFFFEFCAVKPLLTGSWAGCWS